MVVWLACVVENLPDHYSLSLFGSRNIGTYLSCLGFRLKISCLRLTNEDSLQQDWSIWRHTLATMMMVMQTQRDAHHDHSLCPFSRAAYNNEMQSIRFNLVGETLVRVFEIVHSKAGKFKVASLKCGSVLVMRIVYQLCENQLLFVCDLAKSASRIDDGEDDVKHAKACIIESGSSAALTLTRSLFVFRSFFVVKNSDRTCC